MSFLSGFSSSIYLYIIAGLLTLVVVFGGLSWYLKGVADKNSAELKVAQYANSTLKDSLDKKIESCDITDKQLVEYQSKTNTIVIEKNTKLSAIDALPSTPRQIKVKSNESNVAGIDDLLPPDLVSLLKQSSGAVQGSVIVHP